MAYEQKNGQGALFTNTKKQSDKSPDYNGSIMLGQTEYWLSAWVKEGKSGKFLSVAIGKPKNAPQQQPAPAPAPQPQRDDGPPPWNNDDPFPFG